MKKLALTGFILAALIFFAWCLFPIWQAAAPIASTKILARDGSLLYEIPNPQSGLSTPVQLSTLPPFFTQAVLASEDARFYDHHGVDLRAIARVIVDHLHQRPQSGGASTIEQQLVKNLAYPSAPRSVLQKVREAVGAMAWSMTHAKTQTLEDYVNTVSFGNQTIGIEAAARLYFKKSAHDLSLSESALLVGLLPAPSAYDPIKHPAAAHTRQVHVLERMFFLKEISSDELSAATKSDIPVFTPKHPIRAPHFVFHVIDELSQKYPKLRDGDFIIRTTLDPELQTMAEESMFRRLFKVREQHVTDAAVLALDTLHGDILAYVGSAEYFDESIQGQVDMVTALRQPGSALKPFLYFSAFQQGSAPSSILGDVPARYQTTAGTAYEPRNYGLRFHGPVSIRDALGSSLNVPAVAMLNQLGVPSFMKTLDKFGLHFPETPEHYGLSLVLGGAEVSLLDATRGYAQLARGAQSVTPNFIQDIRHADGRLIATAPAAPSRPLFDDDLRARQAAFLVTDILADRSARAMAFGEINLMDIGKRAAVKTGTTKDFHDNWAFGYFPDFALGVWVGNADGSLMNGVSGLTGAVPIWHDVMSYRAQHTALATWPTVEGITTRDICVTSGLLANGICPKLRQERFIQGTEPTQPDSWYIKCNGSVILQAPSQFAPWISESLATKAISANCVTPAVGERTIASPLDGEVFEHDALIADSHQSLPFVASGPGPTDWRLDGQAIHSASSIFLWPLQAGDHRLELVGSSRQVHFFVK